MTTSEQATPAPKRRFIHRYPSISVVLLGMVLGVVTLPLISGGMSIPGPWYRGPGLAMLSMVPTLVVCLPITWITKGKAPTRAFWAGSVPLWVMAAGLLYNALFH